MNKKILIVEFLDKPTLVVGSDSFMKLTKAKQKYEAMQQELGIASIRIEPLIDLDEGES